MTQLHLPIDDDGTMRLELNAQRGFSSVLVVDEAQAIEGVKGFEEPDC